LHLRLFVLLCKRDNHALLKRERIRAATVEGKLAGRHKTSRPRTSRANDGFDDPETKKPRTNARLFAHVFAFVKRQEPRLT
jgi:hypothetical protein